jgi:hypothetical protein
MARRVAGRVRAPSRLERNLSRGVGRAGNKNRRDFVEGAAVMGTAHTTQVSPGTLAQHHCRSAGSDSHRWVGENIKERQWTDRGPWWVDAVVAPP